LVFWGLRSAGRCVTCGYPAWLSAHRILNDLADCSKLVRQLEAYGDAYEHAEPGLLGDQRAERANALLLILLARDAAHLGVVRVSEPATFVERFGEYLLEGRCRVHNDVLRVRETSRLDQRLERRVNFGCRVGTVGQSRSIISR
jgi:hypothetical protein